MDEKKLKLVRKYFIGKHIYTNIRRDKGRMTYVITNITMVKESRILFEGIYYDGWPVPSNYLCTKFNLSDYVANTVWQYFNMPINNIHHRYVQIHNHYAQYGNGGEKA
jgi:hypothetical protein